MLLILPVCLIEIALFRNSDYHYLLPRVAAQARRRTTRRGEFNSGRREWSAGMVRRRFPRRSLEPLHPSAADMPRAAGDSGRNGGSPDSSMQPPGLSGGRSTVVNRGGKVFAGQCLQTGTRWAEFWSYHRQRHRQSSILRALARRLL
jgi:hypothetical protein